VLKRIAVNGFKAIKDSGTITLGNLVLIIGRNGAGKSSLIEALQWLQESMDKGLQAATEDRFRAFDDLRNRRVAEVGLHLEFGGASRPVFYDLWVKSSTSHQPYVADEFIKVGRTSGQLVPLRSRKSAAGVVTRILRHGNPLRDGDQIALGVASKSMGRGVQRLADFIRTAVFLRLSPVAMTHAVALQRRARGPVLDEEGRRLPQLLSQLTPTQREWVGERIAEVIPGVERVRVIRDMQERGSFALDERMTSRGGTKAYPIPSWLLSEGTRRLTALFALLAVTPRPSLIVIEEIENGLDPWTLQIVFNALREAAADGVQIIISTHSPFLLDHVEPEEVIHVERRDGDTLFRAITDYQDVANFRGVVAPGAMYIAGYLGDKE
jgi:energy-coupling factor transporter ATP-binding protein EcfA2